MAKQHKLQPDPASVHAMLVTELEAQCRRFGELDALSQRQSTLVERDDGTELLTLLSERQEVIEDIARINARIEPLRRLWDEVASKAVPTLCTDVETRVASMAGMLHAIRERDESDRQKLEHRREMIRRELLSMSNARKAVGAYGGRASVPQYQDRTA